MDKLPEREVLAELLRKRRKVDSDCWLWQGHVNKKGCGRIALKVGGKWLMFRVHRLAQYIWHEIPLRDKREAHNTCGRRHCFHPDHWEMAASRPSVVGAANSQAKLTEAEAKMLLAAYHKEAASPQELARRIGGKVKARTVEALLKGRTWKHLERPGYKAN